MKRSKIMKTTLLIVVVTFLIIGCDKNDFEFENQFDQSYKSWLAFKKSVNNSYTYKVTGASWIGISWETTITVSSGVVIRREFKVTHKADYIETPKEEDMEWAESEEEIGSKKDTSAADANTLDEVYEIAKNDWLQKRKNTETFFETKNNGIISLCGYIDKDCADDCFRGISITSVEVLGKY